MKSILEIYKIKDLIMTKTDLRETTTGELAHILCELELVKMKLLAKWNKSLVQNTTKLD